MTQTIDVLHIPYLLIEYRGGRPFAYHTIDFPSPRTKGWFRAASSAEWFDRREMQRWRQAPKLQRFCSIGALKLHDRAQIFPGLYYSRATNPHYSILFPYYLLGDCPRFHHSDLWSAYQALGYDYKKRKYISTPSLADYGVPAGPYTEEDILAISDYVKLEERRRKGER
jgi:hypothetical protein